MRTRTAAGLATGLLSPLLLAMAVLPAQAGTSAQTSATGASASTAVWSAGPSTAAHRAKDPGGKAKGSKKIKLYTPTEVDRRALPGLADQRATAPATTRLASPPAGFPKTDAPKSAGQNTLASPVTGYFDEIRFEPGKVRVRGWALNPSAPSAAVQVIARKETGEQTVGVANTYRPDVGNGNYHGFDFTLALPSARGAHTVCMQAYVNYTYTNLGCLGYDSRPFGAFERQDIVATPNGRFSVLRGWLIDPYTNGAAQVDVIRDGTQVLTVPAQLTHQGAAQAYPTYGPSHGFEVWVRHDLPNGNHTICLNGSAGGAKTPLGCKDHDEDHSIKGALDEVTWQGENVVVKGWALDFDTTDPISVSISTGGKIVKTVPANVLRGDVATSFPQYGALHGFEATIPAALDEQEVSVTAKDVVIGTDLTWSKRYDGSSGPCRCVRENFEAGALNKSLFFRAQGQLTADPARLVSGKYSVYGEAPATQEWQEFLWSDPAKLKLAPLTSYTVTFKYRLLGPDGSIAHPYFLARTASGGIPQDAGFKRWEETSDGDVKTASVTFTTKDFSDYYLIWGLNQGGAIAVDDVVLNGSIGRN
ncbi:hypothetical protein AB0B89_14425 [Sphaerisporangium sp. NPDC049002]|uniref:hypothetical protein n=1 Tax=Sphaerisporangium sp. NPDC049002 TaxID=3155392 RepID=UPI0033CC6396